MEPQNSLLHLKELAIDVYSPKTHLEYIFTSPFLVLQVTNFRAIECPQCFLYPLQEYT